MKTLSIGDIQKNIALLTQLTDAFTIIDKRRNKSVAVVYPIRKNSMIDSMAGKYKNSIKRNESLEEAKEIAMMEVMEEKYGLSD